jgi:hypothetical protein
MMIDFTLTTVYSLIHLSSMPFIFHIIITKYYDCHMTQIVFFLDRQSLIVVLIDEYSFNEKNASDLNHILMKY